MMKTLLIFSTIFSLFFFLGLIWLFFQIKKKKRIIEDLEYILFEVKIPKYEKKEGEPQKEMKSLIGMMEQVYSSFLRLPKPYKKRGRIIFEIASQIGGSDIQFFVASPKILESTLEKSIQGIYPGAEIEKVPQDYTIFEPGGITVGAIMMLKETLFLPINTYQNLAQDPLSNLTNALTKIKPEEGAAFQLVLKPFNYSWVKKRGQKLISLLKEGKKFKEALSLSAKGELQESFEKLAGPPKEKQKEEEPYQPKPIDETSIELVNSKIKKPMFETNLRLVASAESQERAKEILENLEAAFGQFSGANSFEIKEIKKRKLKNFIYRFSFREFNKKEKAILNLEELATIYHFPTPYLETPSLKWVKATFAPPPDLPKFGEVLIGKVIFRGETKDVYLATREDRRRHFYIIGQTGTGKTSLLREMIRQDIEKGEGVGVIDPHGELIEDTLANIPPERINDVVLFEPFDTKMPMGLNMLEYETQTQKDFAVQEMIAIFHKLFPPEIIGPMFEHYMRNAMLALMSDPKVPGTLVEIPRIFTDPEFMEEKISHVTDPLVYSFWKKEWKQTTGQTRSDMLGYVVSKVGRFVENEMMRNIIGQGHSSFDLAKIMDEGKIFLANLSKGLTGEINSSLLGLILVSKMQMAAMRRAEIPPEQRKDFYLYVDEFQNFTTDSIVTILSEARKYRLNLILAHQYIPQLTEQIRDAVLGNVGSIGAFRIGVQDAEFLEKQFSPEFSKFDLLNLDNFNLILKLLIEGKTSSPFRVLTIKPKEGNKEIVEKIKKISKMKYSRPKELVEKEIWERSKLGVI